MRWKHQNPKLLHETKRFCYLSDFLTLCQRKRSVFTPKHVADEFAYLFTRSIFAEAVKILVENNVLTIQGTKEQLAEEKTEKVHRYERAYGAFERSFTLPATVDATNIKATYDVGVLTLTLPKVEKAKPREIKLEVVPEKKLKA